MTKQPYAPPADDGGGQGSFSVPENELAQPNAQDPQDRAAVGSFANGAKDQARLRGDSTLPGRASTWIPFRDVWKAQATMLLMLLLFGGIVLVSHLMSGKP